ncbi:MAG: hypothetical protein KKD39_03865 [Candidatus Altiarchaeota archaeon]|nr:hypothetical protein [Candidatus Altiarchaeota archaeon]
MIVVDSGSIISLAMNCLCPLMGMMGKQFVITPKVYQEIIEKPSEGKRFALESIRINRLISSGVINIMKPAGGLGDEIAQVANKIYELKGKPLSIIHPAESEVIAVASEIDASAVMIDERTTRLLIENPWSLRDLLAHRNKETIKVDKKQLKRLQDLMPQIPLIRSAELVAVAYEKGYLTQLYGIDDKKLLEASLTALKYSGCSITWEEIDEYLREEI